jgi:hypothetical protein
MRHAADHDPIPISMEAVMVIHQHHKFRSQPSSGFIIVLSSTAIRKTLAGKSLFGLTNKGWLLVLVG